MRIFLCLALLLGCGDDDDGGIDASLRDTSRPDVGTDTGSDVTATPDAFGMCMIAESYRVEVDFRNSVSCSLHGVADCTLTPVTPGRAALDCGELHAECDFDDSDCSCSGTVTSRGETATLSLELGDSPSLSLRFPDAGSGNCRYMLVPESAPPGACVSDPGCTSETQYVECIDGVRLPRLCAFCGEREGATGCFDFAPSNGVGPVPSPPASDFLTTLDDQMWDTDACETLPGFTKVVTQEDAPDICVVTFDNVQLTGNWVVSGSRSLAIVSTSTLRIDANVRADANGDVAGPGGGEAGGPATPAGGPLPGPSRSEERAGGNGGGAGSAGGAGANPAGVGGELFSADYALSPLRGGSGGSGSTRGTDGITSVQGASGGAGGGAVQLFARLELNISGRIDVSGGGGQQGFSRASGLTGSGGAGGSGGTLLLEGGTIRLGGEVLAAGGGGGSAGCRGGAMPGAENSGATAPLGGSCSSMVTGGRGSEDESSGGAAGVGNASTGSSGGGGGGGSGLIVVRGGEVIGTLDASGVQRVVTAAPVLVVGD